MPLKNIIFLLALLTNTACSPLYILRAGWEEANILAKRESIHKLIKKPDLEKETKAKLQLVLEAREFAQSIGLKPKKSFTKYTDVERDVLLWVLSASKKTSFEFKTWWFPIVGTVPYKGFFEKEDAFDEAKGLQKEGLDIYLRPSPAFSTLGWFNDPLLSTVLAFKETSLANTVIHEILHNTLWVKNHVTFNETLANFVGTYGARDFFRKKGNAKNAIYLQHQWHDEKIFARFVNQLFNELDNLYKDSAKERIDQKTILKKRKEIFDSFSSKWKTQSFKTPSYKRGSPKINNASIVAFRIYLDRPELFEKYYLLLDANLPKFILKMKLLSSKANKEKKAPYRLLEQEIALLESSL